jgi:HK97 family phage major capsid protein
MPTDTLEAPAKRQRIDGDLHRWMPATLTIRAMDPPADPDGDEDGTPDDPLLQLRLSVSSEEPYLRASWWDAPWVEVLGHKSGEIDLTRLNGGAPMLANHDRYTAVGDTPLSGIGVVDRAWIEGGRLMADITISRRDALSDLRQDIADGLVRNVSIGYQINERVLTKQAAEGQPDEYRVTSWTPFEISLVDIPADATVGIGRKADDSTQPRYRVVDLPPAGRAGSTQEKTMTDKVKDPAPAPTDATRSHQSGPDPLELERERAKEITALGRMHNMRDLADKAIDSGMAVDNFRAQVLDHLRQSGALRPAESPEIGMSQKEVEQFSFRRALLAAMDPAHAVKLAPFECEVSRAAQDKRGDSRSKDRESAITIPVDVLASGMSVNERMAGIVASQLIQRAMARAKAGGVDIMHAYRDLVVGTPTAGGNLVATELLGSSFIDLLRNAMVLDQLGITWLRDLNGNVAIPSQTGGATGYWLAESGAPTESQQTVGQMTLTPHTVGAFTDYSRRLLLQSSIDVEMFIRADLAAVLGQTIQTGAINGAGASNEPTGLLNMSGIGSVAGGTNGLAPTYANMVDLESAVANANADSGNLAFLTNTKVRGTLRKTQEFPTSANGRPVWTSQPGSRGVGDVLGYTAYTTNAVPSNLTKGTSTGVCSAIMFGNWADLVIGMWGGLDLLLDPYTGSSAGTRRLVALQDCDVNARHVASFAAMKDALTA